MARWVSRMLQATALCTGFLLFGMVPIAAAATPSPDETSGSSQTSSPTPTASTSSPVPARRTSAPGSSERSTPTESPGEGGMRTRAPSGHDPVSTGSSRAPRPRRAPASTAAPWRPLSPPGGAPAVTATPPADDTSPRGAPSARTATTTRTAASPRSSASRALGCPAPSKCGTTGDPRSSTDDDATRGAGPSQSSQMRFLQLAAAAAAIAAAATVCTRWVGLRCIRWVEARRHRRPDPPSWR